MTILSLLALAIAPGVAISLFIYWKDAHEKEPIHLLILSFVYGGLSVLVTMSISAIIYPMVSIREDNIMDQAFSAFLLVALVEEFSKYIFVRGLLFPKKDFNEPFDGIVYTVMVGMGFATVENIMYVFEGGYGVGVMRMFTAVPAHAIFAILMGYFLGQAKFKQKRFFYSLYGLLAATLFHGAYDFFLFLSFIPGIWLGALVSLVIGIILSNKAIKAHQDISPFK